MRLLPTRFIMAGKACRRRYLSSPKLDGLDVWVSSPGGVGTTFVMEYLSRFVRVNDPYDADGLKHWPSPPKRSELDAAPQMLFVTGDPEEITASIARRDWVSTQSTKIGSLGGILLKGEAQKHAFCESVRKQIADWKACDSEKVLIVEYDDLWIRADEIGKHVGADASSFSAGFPRRRARRSSLFTGGSAR